MSASNITPITAQPITQNANLAKITRFVRAKLDVGAKRFDLVHISDDDGQREGRVDTWPGGAGVRAAEVAAEIGEVARGDPAALGGVNAYAVIAIGDSAGELLARQGFRVAADMQPGGLV